MVRFLSPKTLTAESLAKLAQLGAPAAESSQGWRSVSTMSYISESSSASTINIPDEFDSVETIIFLGLTEVSLPQRFLRDSASGVKRAMHHKRTLSIS